MRSAFVRTAVIQIELRRWRLPATALMLLTAALLQPPANQDRSTHPMPPMRKTSRNKLCKRPAQPPMTPFCLRP